MIRRHRSIIDAHRAECRLWALAAWVFPDVWRACQGHTLAQPILDRWPHPRSLAHAKVESITEIVAKYSKSPNPARRATKIREAADTAINDAGGIVVEKPTKTKRNRIVSLDAATIELLTQHLDAMDERAAVFGVTIPSDGFVFSLDPACQVPMRPELMTRRMRQLRKRLGIRADDFDATILALRKWTSSELMDAGFNPSTVSGRQGHSVQVMLHQYSTRRRSADCRAAEHLGARVHGERLRSTPLRRFKSSALSRASESDVRWARSSARLHRHVGLRSTLVRVRCRTLCRSMSLTHTSISVSPRATLTVEEAARVLGIGRSTAYEAVRCGQIPAMRLGRRAIVPAAWLAQQLGVTVEAVVAATHVCCHAAGRRRPHQTDSSQMSTYCDLFDLEVACFSWSRLTSTTTQRPSIVCLRCLTATSAYATSRAMRSCSAPMSSRRFKWPSPRCCRTAPPTSRPRRRPSSSAFPGQHSSGCSIPERSRSGARTAREATAAFCAVMLSTTCEQTLIGAAEHSTSSQRTPKPSGSTTTDPLPVRMTAECVG